MPSAPASRSLTPDLPLKFVGGNPAVDFVNTVDWTPVGLEHDRLGGYDRLATWARESGVLPDRQVQMLRDKARRDPDAARAAYDQARWARWVLHELLYATAMRQPPAESLAAFNALLRRSHQHLGLAPVSPTRGHRAALAWHWRDATEQLESVLWPVVRAAAELLTSPEATRVRMCAGPDCGWLYVDRSRNGLRQWCEMQTCGTQAKSRRRAERRRTGRLQRPGRGKVRGSRGKPPSV